MQPAVAVNPRSPLSGAGHACLGAGDIARQVLERIDVEWGSVVQAEVEVRLRRVLSTSTATTEQYPHHAVNLNEPLPQLAHRLVIDRPHIMPDQPALSGAASLDRTTGGVERWPYAPLTVGHLGARRLGRSSLLSCDADTNQPSVAPSCVAPIRLHLRPDRACSSYVSGAIAKVIRMPKPRHRAEPHCRSVA